MSKPKVSVAKKAKKEPAFDGDFWDKFGFRVSPDVASVFRCKVCGGYVYPLRRSFWSCSKPLCGPLIPESEIDYRLSCVLPTSQSAVVLDVMQLVRASKPE